MGMTNVAETGLVAGLAQLTRALEARKAELLAELRKLERDIEATERTIDTAARVGFRPAVVPPTLTPRRSDAAAYPPAADAAQPAQAPTSGPNAGPAVADTPAGADTTMLAYARTLASLKTLKPDTALMSAPPRAAKGLRKAAADIPTDGPELEAMKDSVAETSTKAAAAPPGPGGRRRVSSKGLVTGEPLAPAIMNILKATERPLSTAEVAVAMLQARGLDYRGRELVAVVNRVSAILGDLARKKRIQRIKVQDEKERRWHLREPA
jgi:hypothetical protein